jgi:quercetin dioxygenase-like cupin family protein
VTIVPDRVVLGKFDLAAEIERFRPGEGASGRRAETLVKTDRLRLVLVTMRTGAALEEHTAPGPITIQTLRGRFVVTAEGRDHELGEGGLIALEAGVHHAVRAVEDGAFLLTIRWQSREGERSPLPIDTPAPANPGG